VEPLKISLADCPRVTGESMAVVYDAIKAGHLKTFLVGRRRFVRPQALRDWVDYLEAESAAGRPVVYRARGGARQSVADQIIVEREASIRPHRLDAAPRGQS
jgi:hypothetical protein